MTETDADIIYHGTAPKYVDDILTDGLQPRRETSTSNWESTDTPSIPGHVYLTRWFPALYSAAATDETRKFAICEVDLNALETDALYPDEDFIEQADRVDKRLSMQVLADAPGDMRERTETVREQIEDVQPYWELSLEAMGNISHRGTIPVSAIRRVVVSSPSSYVFLNATDTQISLQAIPHIRGKHDMLTRILLGEDVDLDSFLRATILPDGLDPDEVDLDISEKQKQQVQRAIDDTTVEVHENPLYDP